MIIKQYPNALDYYESSTVSLSAWLTDYFDGHKAPDKLREFVDIYNEVMKLDNSDLRELPRVGYNPETDSISEINAHAKQLTKDEIPDSGTIGATPGDVTTETNRR